MRNAQMLNLFKTKSKSYLRSFIIAPLVFSTLQVSAAPFDSTSVYEYINKRHIFSTPLQDMEKLEGMNDNFFFTAGGKKYVMCNVRNDLISFNTYIKNYEAIAYFMSTPKIVFVDYSRKIFIREFIDGEVLQDNIDDQNVAKAAEIIHALHNSALHLEKQANAKQLIARMNAAISKNGKESLSQNLDYIVQRVYQAIEKHKVPNRPSHNDLNANNFLITEKGMKLIDWEFSGPNDPAWDLAYFITISRLPAESIDVFINKYISMGNVDPNLMDRVAAYQPITLIFLSTFFDYRDNKYPDLSQFCMSQAKELYESSRVQAAIKRLENKAPTLKVSFL